MAVCIYLDESGDLGWKFDAPYRNGGSSRYLTIACLITPKNKRNLPKRILRKMYKRFDWNTSVEKKWSQMNIDERIDFAKRALALRQKHPDIKYFSMTVKKENVQSHIRHDPNKLYNYMTGLLLLEEMSHFSKVEFYPDPRSIKVESGNSMQDYLQIQLWFEKNTSTILTTIPAESSSNLNVQFADMLSGVVQGHFEDNNSSPWRIMASSINTRRLFF